MVGRRTSHSRPGQDLRGSARSSASFPAFTTRLLDGRKAAEHILAGLHEKVGTLAKTPRLGILHFQREGELSPFIRAKVRACEKAGIEARLYPLPENISATTLTKQIAQLAHAAHLDGIVVQLPLPAHLDGNRHGVLRAIPEDRDVDCISERWFGRFQTGRTTLHFPHGRATLLSPVTAAIAYFCTQEKIALSGKRVLVVGWGDLVGKPTAVWFLHQGAVVTIATHTTTDLVGLAQDADIIVSGVGKAHLIRGAMVQNGAVVFDAGSSSEHGAPVGDVEQESVMGKAAALTPVPGGVGPLTVAMLLSNIVAVTAARAGLRSVARRTKRT